MAQQSSARQPLPTFDQIELIFGSFEVANVYLTALKSAGAPITVDTCHAVKIGGVIVAPMCAAPDFNYQGGRRALGLL